MILTEPTMKVEDVILEETEEYLLDDENPPIFARTDNEENMNSNTHKSQFLKHYGLVLLALSKVHNWLIALGMKRGAANKIFYIDNHKSEGTVQYRWLSL